MQIKIYLGLLVLSVSVMLQGCGGGSSGDSLSAGASYAPAESVHKTAYYRYPTPPSGFTAIVGWMQAIDILGTGSPSTVEVDWMRVHVTVNGMDTILFEDTFDSSTPDMDWYGLYSRNPWFAGDRLAVMPFSLQNSTLFMEPSLHPNRIFHWWSTSRSLIPANASRVWFEARVRITGGAGVQAGIDYWKDLTASDDIDESNTEGGASDWYGNSTNDWQIVSAGRP
jgi:hypothetical protein